MPKAPPAGPGWIHEIKHDGYRILAERDRKGVTLRHTRQGYELHRGFTRVVAAIARLPARSCVIDGEAIACDANAAGGARPAGGGAGTASVILCALDLP